MRGRWLAAATVTGLMFGLGVLPGTANAATCDPTNHCYGQAEWHTDQAVAGTAVDGISEILNVHCLYLENTSNFVTQEMWLGTNNSVASYWVEEGMAYGNPEGAKRYWFWAANNPHDGYHEHDQSIAADLLTDYSSEISWAGNDSWTVRRNGDLLGTAVNNPSPSVFEAAGEEMAGPTAEAAATHTSLIYQGTDGAWRSDWIIGTDGAVIYANEPPYASWTTGQYSGLGVFSNCSYTPIEPRPTAQPITGGPAARLAKIANGLAAANGESSPRSVEWVSTHRRAAVRLDSNGSDSVTTDEPVYMLRMQGHFTGRETKHPSGATPRGTVMTATVDRATGSILDWSILHASPDLATLGPVTHLY